jgi:AcrR family transcriptional regulator
VRKVSITPERIVATALTQIEENGLDGFSTRKLGAALSIEAMSLYHYYPSKGHLLDAIAERILSEVIVPDEPRHDPLERLRQVCLCYREVMRAHPRMFFLVATRRFNTPGTLAMLEDLMTLFQSLGLSPERSVYWFRLLIYFLNGSLISELTLRGLLQDATRSVVDTGVPEGLPAVMRAAPFLGATTLEDTFQEGLALLLTQLSAELAAASSPAT